jgi:hypothetical protein
MKAFLLFGSFVVLLCIFTWSAHKLQAERMIKQQKEMAIVSDWIERCEYKGGIDVQDGRGKLFCFRRDLFLDIPK